MVAVGDYCKQILDDLKHSWYFRVWAVTWLVCAIVALVAMAYYANRESENREAQGLRLFVTQPDFITFPDFTFSVPDDATYTITNAVCYCKNDPNRIMRAQPCPNTSLNKCSSFVSPVNNVCNVFKGSRLDLASNQIRCEVNTTVPPANSDNLLSFALQNSATSVMTNNPGSYVYVTPTERAWILLTKSQLTTDGNLYDNWARSLSYLTTVTVPGHFVVSLVLNSDQVQKFEGKDWFTGWISAGQLGGFVFLLYLIHKVFMFLVGFIFTNDSVFLAGPGGYKQDNEVTDNNKVNTDTIPVDSAYPAQIQ